MYLEEQKATQDMTDCQRENNIYFGGFSSFRNNCMQQHSKVLKSE